MKLLLNEESFLKLYVHKGTGERLVENQVVALLQLLQIKHGGCRQEDHVFKGAVVSLAPLFPNRSRFLIVLQRLLREVLHHVTHCVRIQIACFDRQEAELLAHILREVRFVVLEVVGRAAQQHSVRHRVRKPPPRLHHLVVDNAEALHEELRVIPLIGVDITQRSKDSLAVVIQILARLNRVIVQVHLLFPDSLVQKHTLASIMRSRKEKDHL